MRDLRRQVQAIAREIGLDCHEIEARKRFLELGEDDCRLLAEVHELIALDGGGFADGFYDHLLSFPQLRELVPDAATEARLHHAQEAYFSSLTCGRYDQDYMLDRLRVGAVHEKIGLQPKWYIGAYRKYLSEIVAILGRQLQGQPERFSAAVDALLKVVCFDMGLALDTDRKSVV